MKRVIIITIAIISSMLGDSVFADHPRHGNHEAIYHQRHELPRRVISRLADRYHHFDLIHTRRVHRRGGLTFDLLIQHGSTFIELTIGERQDPQ